MNSSKVIVIFSLSKKTVFILGEALIITGGKVSFKPPVGLDLLAHWVMETIVKNNKKHLPNLFIPTFCPHKIKQYYHDNLLAGDTILRGHEQSLRDASIS